MQEFFTDVSAGGWLLVGIGGLIMLALAAKFRLWITGAILFLMQFTSADLFSKIAFPIMVLFVLTVVAGLFGNDGDDDLGPEDKGYDHAKDAADRNNNWHWHHDPYK